jgi:outer membrane receptor for ferrienterochelin and colicin
MENEWRKNFKGENGMKKLFGFFVVLTLFAGSILCANQTGFAQEDDGFMLEEITVTAQKREENKQKVAIAMEVLAGEDLEATGKNDLSEILENISSIIVNKTGSNLRVSLRGISDDQGDGSVQISTPTVAVNTDGIMSNRQKSGTGLFDIERVEVLYGPQSTSVPHQNSMYMRHGAVLNSAAMIFFIRKEP